MIHELITVFLVGGIVVLDTTPFFQSMISQPIVVCSFFGFLWGDVYTGALLGVILELIWLQLIPIGGFISQQGNFGAFAAVTSAIYTIKHFNIQHNETLIFIFVLYSLFISLIAGTFTYKIRLMNRKIALFYDRKNINLLKKIDNIQFYAILNSYIAGGIFCVITFIAGVFILGNLISRLKFNFGNFSEVGIYSILGIGCGIVLSMFWERKKNILFFAGVLTGIILLILGLPL